MKHEIRNTSILSYLNFYYFVKSAVMLIVFLLISCGDLGNKIDNTQQILEDAIAKLDENSKSWQTVLQQTQSQLTSDAQSTIRNEVSNTLTRGVAAAGVESKCLVDFLGQRAKAEIRRLLEQLKLNRTVPPLPPVFCQIVPSTIDMNLSPDRRNKLEIFGYDFDRAGSIQVRLLDKDNNVLADGTTHLNRLTHYQMVINLGSNGIQIDRRAQSIAIYFDNKEISKVAISQPPLPCTILSDQDLNPIASLFDLSPNFTTNDDKVFTCGRFNLSSCTVNLSITANGQEISASMAVSGQECCHDTGLFDPCRCDGFGGNCNTRIAGNATAVLYRAPAGQKINRILSSFNYSAPSTNIPGDGRRVPISGGDFLRGVACTSQRSGREVVINFDFKSIRVQLCNI